LVLVAETDFVERNRSITASVKCVLSVEAWPLSQPLSIDSFLLGGRQEDECCSLRSGASQLNYYLNRSHRATLIYLGIFLPILHTLLDYQSFLSA